MQIDFFEVLVVDDVLSAAEDFARLIHAKTGLKTTYTSSAKEAINILFSVMILKFWSWTR